MHPLRACNAHSIVRKEPFGERVLAHQPTEAEGEAFGERVVAHQPTEAEGEAVWTVETPRICHCLSSRTIFEVGSYHEIMHR
jgi:hypothetical protein